jgi:hypothetical protein
VTRYRNAYDVGDILNFVQQERDHTETVKKENAARLAEQIADMDRAERTAIETMRHNGVEKCIHDGKIYTIERDHEYGNEWIHIEPENPIPTAYQMKMIPAPKREANAEPETAEAFVEF